MARATVSPPTPESKMPMGAFRSAILTNATHLRYLVRNTCALLPPVQETIFPRLVQVMR